MTADRRTKAQLQEALAEARAQLAAKPQEDDRDLESIAMDGCVKALDPVRRREENSRNSSGSYRNTYSTYGNVAWSAPVSSPVERVLAYLRTRYGLLDPAAEAVALRRQLQEITGERDNLRMQLENVRNSLGREI